MGGELLGHHQQHPQDGEEQHTQQDERHLAEGGPFEDHRHRGALHRQPGHPADRRQQPERRGERDPPPHPVRPPGEGEEPPVDVPPGLRRGLTRHGPSPSTPGPRPGPSERGRTLWGEAPGPGGPACAPPLYCNSLATVRANCTGGRHNGQALSPSRSGRSSGRRLYRPGQLAGGGESPGGSVAPSGSPPGRLLGPWALLSSLRPLLASPWREDGPGGSGGTADTHGLGPCAREGVGVRVPPSAPESEGLLRNGFRRGLAPCRRLVRTNTSGWERTITRVASGTHGVTSSTGSSARRDPPRWERLHQVVRLFRRLPVRWVFDVDRHLSGPARYRVEQHALRLELGGKHADNGVPARLHLQCRRIHLIVSRPGPGPAS